jgi:cell division protein FtsB
MRPEQSPQWKKFVAVIVLVVGFVMVARSVVSLYELYRRSDVVFEQQKKLKELEQKQIRLKQQVSESYTPEFIEAEAREKLGMVKPGEITVYLESDLSSSAGSLYRKRDSQESKRILFEWVDLFLGNVDKL